MLRGGELSQPYRLDEGGRPVPAGDATRLRPGDVEAVSPRIGDIHRMTNAFADRVSISIHVYGANIGKVERAVFLDERTVKPFVSAIRMRDAASRTRRPPFFPFFRHPVQPTETS